MGEYTRRGHSSIKLVLYTNDDRVADFHLWKGNSVPSWPWQKLSTMDTFSEFFHDFSCTTDISPATVSASHFHGTSSGVRSHKLSMLLLHSPEPFFFNLIVTGVTDFPSVFSESQIVLITTAVFC